MTIKIVSLTQCPYCDDGAGDIFLDPHATHDLLVSQADCTSEEDNHAKLMTHNSPQVAEVPCPHLVRLWMAVSWGRELKGRLDFQWEIEIGWECPLLRELHFRHPARGLLMDFECGEEHEDFLPSEPHEFDRFGARWPDVRHIDGPRHSFDAHGQSVFAEHVPSFIDELSRQHERLSDAWKSGRSTKREWREVLAQREYETDYEYEA